MSEVFGIKNWIEFYVVQSLKGPKKRNSASAEIVIT